MSGYGGPDDESIRAQIRVDEAVAVAKASLPKGPGSLTCLDCGTGIPEARRRALPGVIYCVDCAGSHEVRLTAKEPWAT